MPLPFLEKPLAPKVIGAPARSLNYEAQSWTTSSSSAAEVGGISQVQITTSTRHFFKPYERLALQDVPASGAITTRWLLPTAVNTTGSSVSVVV